MPILYEVQRLRDGNSFATRRVDAIQKGNLIFTLVASFQVMQLLVHVHQILSLTEHCIVDSALFR